MIWNCFQWPGFGSQIKQCNEHIVKIDTGFQLSIMYTKDESIKDSLIEWQTRFDDFSNVVRCILIKLHRGEELTEDELEKPEIKYTQLTTSIEISAEKKYLKRYHQNTRSILSIFRDAVKTL